MTTRLEARRRRSAVGTLARGFAAGVTGTAAMDGWYQVLKRLRNGAKATPDPGPKDWTRAPAPAQVARLAIRAVTKRDVPTAYIDVLTNVTHWGYGISWGVLYAGADRALRRNPIRSGVPFGATVWGLSYVILPALKLYKPIWRYPPKTLAIDLSYHLAYGLGVANGYRALNGRRGS
jgi:hypothetical protein